MKPCHKERISESERLSDLPKTVEDDHFKQLRPSKELLYYRRKIMELSKEFQEMDAKVEKCISICDKYNEINVENQKKQFQVIQLQDTVSDLQVHLYQEREQVLRLYAENDRLKIRALQDRKKINYLLSMTSTSEKELNLICTRPWRTLVPQKDTSALPKKSKSTSSASVQSSNNVDVDSLLMQNKALSSQLEEQTRLFQDNFHTLLRDRELQRKEAAVQFEHCQETISRLSSELRETQQKLCDSVKDMLLLKEEHLKTELSWVTQRETYFSSLQKYGSGNTLFENNVNGGGNRGGKSSKACEIRLLRDELNQRDQVIAMYQEQCTLLDEQTSSLNNQLEACKVNCKDRIQQLQQIVTVLKEKNNALDKRRRLESEGFRSDVRLLRNRLQDVERTLVKLTRKSTIKVDEDLLTSAIDTASKAKLLEKELLLIKKKMSELDTKLIV